MAIALLLPLANQNSTALRIFSLIFGGALLANSVRRAEFVLEKQPEFSLINGYVLHEEDNWKRKAAAAAVVCVSVALYGWITWPHETQKPKAIAIQLPPAVSYPTKQPPLAILPTTPVIPAMLVPGPSPKTPKPKPVPKDYPIVTLSDSKVTYDKDNRKITIIVWIRNTTQTEVNAHISLHGIGFVGTTAISGILNPTERDIGLPPPPNRAQMSTEYTISPEALPSYDDGTMYIMLYLNVSYPDRGGTTTYHYQGKTSLKSEPLDEQSSGWDGPS